MKLSTVLQSVAAAVLLLAPGGMTCSAASVSGNPACGAVRPAREFREVLFSVDMHCGKCVDKIRDNVSFEKGVKDMKVSLEERTVWIKYDASKTSEQKLAAALEKLGYKAEVVRPETETR